MLSITRRYGVALLIMFIAAFSACGGPDPEPQNGSRQPTPPPTSPSGIADSPTGPDAPTPSPADGSLPRGWTACTNEAHAYTIGYPEGWHAASTNQRNRCRWFDRNPFNVEPATEPPATAITVNPTQRPYEKARAQLQESPRHEVEAFETVTVGGLEAIRYERVQTENLLYPAGTQTYGYLFDHHGSALYLETRKIPGTDTDYQGNKQVLDKAARTFEFQGAA